MLKNLSILGARRVRTGGVRANRRGDSTRVAQRDSAENIFRKSYFFSCNISLSMLQGAHENCKRGGIRLGGSDIKHTALLAEHGSAEFNILDGKSKQADFAV